MNGFQVHRKAGIVNYVHFQIFQTRILILIKMKTNESYSPLYIPPSPEVKNVNGIFYDLIDIRKKYTKNFLICHLNINTKRYKFNVIKELLSDKVVDCLIV
jgi:hypothetical protein